MSKCKDFEALLGALIDGELGGEQGDSVRRHVDSCSGCAGHLRRIQAIEALTAAAGVPAVTEEEWARVGERLRAAVEKSRRPAAGRRRIERKEWLVPALAMAALILMGLTFFLFWTPKEEVVRYETRVWEVENGGPDDEDPLRILEIEEHRG